MKFLLVAVNAKYIHSNPGLYSLAAYAAAREPSVRAHIELAEYTINHSPEEVLYDLYDRKPDVIGFSCYIWNISYIESLLEQVHTVLPDAKLWLGGPEAYHDARRVLENYPMLTGVMTGEGEQTFWELLSYYIAQEDGQTGMAEGKAARRAEAPGDLRDIRGLVFRSHSDAPNEIVRTEKRPLMALSELPFPYDDLTPFENRILYYESSRGCPFRCSYCLSSIDKSVRLREPETVKRELSFFLQRKVRQVKFVDRTFNCDHAHAVEIWRYLLAHDNGVTNFHFEIAGDLLNEEELSLLERFRPGAVQLEIGVQSVNPKTLEEIHRTADFEKLRGNVGRIKAGGNIHIHLDLIAGLPYEDYESFAGSFDAVYAMQPEQLQLGFLKVLKGSGMQERCETYGLKYTACPPYEVLCTNWISFEELHRLKQIERMVEIYYNSNQFTTTLRLVMRDAPSPFAFFEKLAESYERKGYFRQSPARSFRYEALFNFLRESMIREKETEALLREALTMDIYLRENIKTRPALCGDSAPWKEEARAFFREEAEKHAVLGAAYAQADAKALARMTHVERFAYDLQTGEKREQPVLCLFDYKRRSPLTGAAETIIIS